MDNVVAEQQFRHDWLYLTLPITPTYTLYSPGDSIPYNNIPNDWAVLCGFCRVCRHAFSVRIPVSSTGELLVSKVDVPKWGCVDPNIPV